jgi:glycosyltransferase involved in cell wall biosynthesis
MSIKVSVIIPVYNAEKYLAECIESLLCQTLKECEFIFVNDGSKDSSWEILERYKNLDSRIILIHQQNGGVSSARNKGLDIASGEYVGFVDADDYVEKDMFQVLYEFTKEDDSDVGISNFEFELDGQIGITKYHFPLNKTLSNSYIQEEIIPYLLKTDNLNAIWNKIYKNIVLKERNVRFVEGMSLGEDALFNIKFFSKAKKARYVNYCGYHYREVPGSASRNILEKNYFQKAIATYQMEIPELKKIINNDQEIKMLKSIKLINNVMSYIYLYFKPSNDLTIIRRFFIVQSMIVNRSVREALPYYYIMYKGKLNMYETCILRFIKWKFTIGLFCTTAYSRFRNR